MVDLTLFHQIPNGEYRAKDRLNRRAGRMACSFLEWTGWYNLDIPQRLLGHYRLFQIYKKDPDNTSRNIDLPKAYILQYRSKHFLKYALSRSVSIIYSIFTLGRPYLPVEIETFNRSLINEHADILQAFLAAAETDFTSAFLKATAELNNIKPNDLNNISNTPQGAYKLHIQPVFLNYHHDLHVNNTFNTRRNDFHTHNNYENDYSVHTHVDNSPNTVEGKKGKEKDVFSKKQVLILLHLVSESTQLEKIDFRKQNKYDDLANLLHAITGRSKNAWKEELNNYKTKDLFEFHLPGELNQLIVTITNLAEFFRKAGFHSIAAAADKKIMELEKQKRIE
jgi:hypothetical protein